MRKLFARLGLIVTPTIVMLMEPATAIANARISTNHNEIMVT
jgi:hypothetical protein